MEPITAVGLTIASIKSLELLVERLHNAAGANAKKKLARWRTRSGLKTAFQKITAVRKVKTIWQIDKEVDLADFYYPTRVLLDNEKIALNSLGDLPDANHLFTGTAGQGKSILLRYLCAAELAAGNRFPLFLQLRRLDDDARLLDLALTACKDLDLPLVEEEFEDLAHKGLLMLLLDGFDEIAEQFRSKVIADIESLANRHPEMRIIASSRPGSGIEQSPCLRLMPLVPLDASDLPHIVRRLTADDALTERLLDAISAKPSIGNLLTTPLLVTLLLITYKAEQTIPDAVSDFYDGLFDLLLSRHDKTKPGFLRPRACGLGNKAMEEVFDSFCFATRKQQKTVLKSDEALAAARSALEHTVHDADPEKFLDDICKITCLLVEEGRLLHFLHKSVQEYHTARFLRSLPDVSLGRYYKRVRTGVWRQWRQELLFLGEIDAFRFAQYFAIPELEGFLATVDPGVPVTSSTVETVLGECNIGIDYETGQLHYFGIGEVSWFVDSHFFVIMDELSLIDFYDVNMLTTNMDQGVRGEESLVCFLPALFEAPEYSDTVSLIIQRLGRAAAQLLANYRAALERQTSKDFLGDLWSDD